MTRKRISEQKDISGCAIAGMMSETGRRTGGERIIRFITNMHDRSNGLGGGFAAYGIYPEHRDKYALHVMYDDIESKRAGEEFIRRHCDVHNDEPIPIRPLAVIRSRPILHRYFVTVRPEAVERHHELSEDDIIVHMVMRFNATIDGAFLFSSGRNGTLYAY